VESRMKRFLSFIENKARSDHRYKKCMSEYGKRRNNDRIRKRANRNIDEFLNSILAMNKIGVSEV